MQQFCVVKLMNFAAQRPTESAVARIQAEASAGFSISHPCVVRVIDCDEQDGYWFFVMEFVDGVDLSCLMPGRVRLDWRQAVSVAADVAGGLEAIHRAGIVHRDIRPDNLIFGVDGRVRVADLGVAWLRRGVSSLGPQLDEMGVGFNQNYAAPEVFTGETEIGPTADLYSLGAILFESITGQPPHSGSHYRSFIDRSIHPPVWPASAPRDVPQWFVDAILKLLAPSPADRFASSRDLDEQLALRNGRRPAPVAARTNVQAEPRGVVVLPFVNNSGDESDAWLGQALADHLARNLKLHQDLYVADREEFQSTLDRVKSRVESDRGAQLLHAARLSGARVVFEGRFRRDGDFVELDASIYAADRSAPTLCAPVRGALANLAELEAALLHHLLAELGLATAADSPPSRRVEINAERLLVEAQRSARSGAYDRASELALEAFRLDPKYGAAVGFAGICCARAGRYEQSAQYNEKQQTIARETGDERLLAEAYANRGTMHYFRGEFESACDWLSRSAKLAERLGQKTDVALIRNNLGFVLMQLNRHEEAEEMFNLAIEHHHRNGATTLLIGPYNGLGNVLRKQEKFEEARGRFRLALSVAQDISDIVNVGVAYLNLGHCALLQHKIAVAKDELAIAMSVLEQTSFWNGLARVYEHLADLNLFVGNGQEAVRCADRRIELAVRHCNSRMQQAAWEQKAAGLRLCGRFVEAEQCLTPGVRQHRSG